MIRRVQAEALLKLAEALEECERLGFFIGGGDQGSDAALFYGEDCDQVTDPAPIMRHMDVRMAVAELYPKSEAAE